MPELIFFLQNACRSDADMRAADIASFMSELPLQLAIKYASKMGKMYLTDKLSHVRAVDWTKLSEQMQAAYKRKNFSKYDDFGAGLEECHVKNRNNTCSQPDLFEDTPPVTEGYKNISIWNFVNSLNEDFLTSIDFFQETNY